MAVHRSAASLAASVVGMGERLERAKVDAARVGGRVAAAEIGRHGSAVKLRAKNGTKKPLRAKVFSGVDVAGDVAKVAVDGVPLGWWSIVQDGSKPHDIKPRSRKVKVLRTPYGPRRSVRHPGHGRIRDVWGPAVTAAGREAGEAMQDVIAKAIRG